MAKTTTLSQPFVASRSCSGRQSKLCFQLWSSTSQWTSGVSRIFAFLASQDERDELLRVMIGIPHQVRMDVDQHRTSSSRHSWTEETSSFRRQSRRSELSGLTPHPCQAGKPDLQCVRLESLTYVSWFLTENLTYRAGEGGRLRIHSPISLTASRSTSVETSGGIWSVPLRVIRYVEHGPLGRAGRDEPGVGKLEFGVLGDLVDQVRPGGRRGDPQLHVRVAAPLGDVAGRAVDVQVGPDPGLARGLRVVGIDQAGPVFATSPAACPWKIADVLERAELVVDHAAVVVVAVELERVEAQEEARGAGVADQALGAGGELPGLGAMAARVARVGHLVLLRGARGGDQLRVGLLGVPR